MCGSAQLCSQMNTTLAVSTLAVSIQPLGISAHKSASASRLIADLLNAECRIFQFSVSNSGGHPGSTDLVQIEK
jgi:hypothetical protein